MICVTAMRHPYLRLFTAGALAQRRVPATYAGKATTPPPPAANRSKRSLISSNNTVNDAETIEHLQDEVRRQTQWRGKS